MPGRQCLDHAAGQLAQLADLERVKAHQRHVR